MHIQFEASVLKVCVNVIIARKKDKVRKQHIIILSM